MKEKKQNWKQKKTGQSGTIKFKKNTFVAVFFSTNSIERLDKTLKRQRENTKNREKVQEN